MKKLLFAIILALSSSMAYGQKNPKLEEYYLKEAKKTYEYKRVYVAVHESLNYINMAEKGTIKKSIVIDHYKEVLSGYMGQYNTYQLIKDRVRKSGKDLLKMVQLKCASKLALEDAAEN